MRDVAKPAIFRYFPLAKAPIGRSRITVNESATIRFLTAKVMTLGVFVHEIAPFGIVSRGALDLETFSQSANYLMAATLRALSVCVNNERVENGQGRFQIAINTTGDFEEKGQSNMKIRLEIPKTRQLPSQGRNADSISAGSATAFDEVPSFVEFQRIVNGGLVERQFYRAVIDSDKSDCEFVFFVGWLSANQKLVFEDGHGDVLVFKPDEVELV